MVTSSISLHISLSRPNFAVPHINIGVNNFALFVGTRMEAHMNRLEKSPLVWCCALQCCPGRGVERGRLVSLSAQVGGSSWSADRVGWSSWPADRVGWSSWPADRVGWSSWPADRVGGSSWSADRHQQVALDAAQPLWMVSVHSQSTTLLYRHQF